MLVWLSLIWAECQWYTRCPNWLQTALFSFRGHLMMCLPTRPTQKEQGFNKLVFCLRSSRSLWGSSSPLSPWDHLQLVNLPIRDTYTLKCCLFSFSPWFQTSRNQIASVWNAFTGKGENGTRGHILLWENKQTLPTEKKKKNTDASLKMMLTFQNRAGFDFMDSNDDIRKRSWLQVFSDSIWKGNGFIDRRANGSLLATCMG